MSKASKTSLFVSLLALIAYAVSHLTFGRLPIDYALLGVFGLTIAASIFFDRALWGEFLTMRTTKHGMNMGALILVMLLGIVCVNYLALKHNKTWDLTKERLNSLSEQTTKLLDGLDKDLNVRLFYDAGRAAEAKTAAQAVLNPYREYSGKVRISSANSMVPDAETLSYLKDQPDAREAPLVAFVEYGGKRIRVTDPIDEANVTSAIIRATRTGDVVAYFVQGHGELDLAGQDEKGASDLARALKDASFRTESLDLLAKREIPKDASVVAILGPHKAYLDDEIKILLDYARAGGRLLVALDPFQRHNLANLIKPLGVEFTNAAVAVAPRDQLQNGGPFLVLGRTFDPGSPITANFSSQSSFALFAIASELKVAPGASFETHELVKSISNAVTISNPTERVASAPHVSVLALSSAGKLEGGGEKAFEAVVFGDSDFASNRFFAVGSNRDLVLNAFAELANQKDLISIKPKLPAGTSLVMTPVSAVAIILTTIAMPVALLIVGLWLWWRRRSL